MIRRRRRVPLSWSAPDGGGRRIGTSSISPPLTWVMATGCGCGTSKALKSSYPKRAFGRSVEPSLVIVTTAIFTVWRTLIGGALGSVSNAGSSGSGEALIASGAGHYDVGFD